MSLLQWLKAQPNVVADLRLLKDPARGLQRTCHSIG